MKKEFRYLRRQLCRWIVGFDNCPNAYRKDYASLLVKGLCIAMTCLGIICFFFILIIFLQPIDKNKKICYNSYTKLRRNNL